MSQDIAARFAIETADHRMTVLHDDGLYRHLHFRAPESSMYWFDLITAPGMLLFQGDGDSFQFRRIQDMFEFFRGKHVNPGYWAEKITDGRDRAMKYDPDIFEAKVKQAFVEAVKDRVAPSGLGRAVRRDLLDSFAHFVGCEEGARAALVDFEHKGFRFEDSWEWDLQDYDWWFLWALHAIVWGIASYDRGECAPFAAPVKASVPKPDAQPRVPAVVDATVSGGVL